MPELRQMYLNDLRKVLDIIEAVDDDDAEAAERDYHEEGFDNQYVLELEQRIIGVTGYRTVEAGDGACWLSWTYVKASEQGKGHGKFMLTQLLQKLREAEARKIFVKVSDYECPDDGKIYERALKMYQSAGFELEVTTNDFYDEGENQLILGLPLKAAQGSDQETQVQEEKPVIRFNGLHEIAETEGAYTFEWTVEPKASLFGKRSFSVMDLNIGLDGVKEGGGRKIFLTFPSNLPLIHKPLQAAGFKYIGQLADYYEQGVHEMHFTHDLDKLSNTSREIT